MQMSGEANSAQVDGELPMMTRKLGAGARAIGSVDPKGPDESVGRLGGLGLLGSNGWFGGASVKSPGSAASSRLESVKESVKGEVNVPGGSRPQAFKLHEKDGAQGGSGGARAGHGLGRGLRAGLDVLGEGLRSEAHKVSRGLRRVLESTEDQAPNEAAGVVLEEDEVEKLRRKQIALVVGLRLNQYTFTEFLGAGGEAWVYGATDGSGGKRAMRVINGLSLRALEDPTNASFRRVSLKDAAGARNLRVELAIIRKVEHPAVMRVYEVLDLADATRGLKALCIVMDYVDGGPIVSDAAVRSMNASFWADRAAHRHAHAHEGSIYSTEQCASYFAQALAGLDYLHHNDILHGDIKPSNILLDRARGRVVLCDFGASRLMHLESADGGDGGDGEQRGIVGSTMLPCHGGQGRGTLLFFPPEACRLEGLYDGRAADVWAASLVLYVLLFRHLPFSEAEEADKVVAQLLAPAELFVSDDTHWYSSPERKHAREFVLQLLAKDPLRRLSTVPATMAHKWMAKSGTVFASLCVGMHQRPTLRSQLTVRDVTEATTEVTFSANMDAFANASVGQFGRLLEGAKERASSIGEFALAGAAQAGRRVSVALSEVSLSLGSLGDHLSDLGSRWSRGSRLSQHDALHGEGQEQGLNHHDERDGGDSEPASFHPPKKHERPKTKE